jgi:hypothetical protein
MHFKRHIRRLLDRGALSDSHAGVFFGFTPVLLYIGLIELGVLPWSNWIWAGAGILTAAILLAVGLRGYKLGRRFTRPVDKLRDEWARNNQSDDYR